MNQSFDTLQGISTSRSSLLC